MIAPRTADPLLSTRLRNEKHLPRGLFPASALLRRCLLSLLQYVQIIELDLA